MADLKIKNPAGQEQVYNGITSVSIPKADGSGYADFQEGGGSDGEVYFAQASTCVNNTITTLQNTIILL